MIVGRTRRLVLEPLAMCHAEGLFAALRHDSVDEFLPSPDVTSVENLRERIARLSDEAAPPGEVWLNFVVIRDHTVIGRIEATSYGTWAEIAYLLGPSFQRQGFGREAVHWLVDRLLDAGCSDVWASVHADNVRSIALLENLGFALQPHVRRQLSSYDIGDLVFCYPKNGS